MKPHLVLSAAALAVMAAGSVAAGITQRGIDRVEAGTVAVADRAAAPVIAPSAEPPPEFRLPQAEDAEISLIAVGDVMLSRVVGAKMRERGFDHSFAAMRDWLCGADVVFGNLETPIAKGRVIRTGEMAFRADPGSEKAMARACVDIVSLANNHTPNFGDRGLRETFAFLKDAGIAYAGAGEDAARAALPAIVESRGRRIAFLAYNDSDVVPASYGAAENRSGTAFMDAAKMAGAVESARTEADIVIVSMHSGTEYAARPNPRQTAFARAAIDAGADMVIGHHPHVVQTAEKYKGKWIFYSLGNFIFDQMWSRQTREGLGLKAVFGRNGVSRIELMPVLISDFSQPAPYAGPAAEKVLSRLGVPIERTSEGVYILTVP